MDHQLRVIVYSRVSTDAQERDGTSLDTQEQACSEYARAGGCEIVEGIRDTASGYTLDRPGIERVRQMLRQGSADVVVSYAVDRLSRNQNHIGVLFDEAEQAGARLEFVTEKFEDTAIGRFILAARAFIGEVEREKIAERTMRGKDARARSGRIPQATGKGIYGYRYVRETGKRETVEHQAEVVRRLFSEFVGGGSIVGIANSLNEEGIRTFADKMWSPATIFHMLKNETYTGRTVHKRTKATTVRDPRTGKKRRHVELRSQTEWIDVPDATPPIVSMETFSEAQSRLGDPERLRRGRQKASYSLGGRVKCMECGKSMVGQTLQGKYRYYRCRRAFAGPRHDRCPSRYVRAQELEDGIRQEVGRVLSDPSIVLAELSLFRDQDTSAAETGAVEGLLDTVDEEKQRLVRLYQWGEINDTYFSQEADSLRLKREALLERLRNQSEPRHIAQPMPGLVDVASACERVRDWIEAAEGDDMALLANALQLNVQADSNSAILSGVIPEYAPSCSDADVCTMVTKSSTIAGRLPSI